MKRILGFVLLAALSTRSLRAADKLIGMEVSAGLPQVISLQLTYLGLGPIIIGVGFGSAPVNGFLQQQIPTTGIALNLGLPDPYSLVPSASFSFTTTSLFVRYQPSTGARSGFLAELNIARWKFNANLVGDLRNENTGVISPSAATGTFDYGQPALSGMVGYRFAIGEGFGIQLQTGVICLFGGSSTTVMGGDLTAVLPFAGPTAQADFERAKLDINSQVTQGAEQFQQAAKWLPALSLTLGYAF